jgi:predicted ATPase/DNA-binding XRE family transcriptional regulator
MISERPAFGTLLREFRLAAGLSQEALAELATISADGISALERGTSRTPQRETLELLVNALQLDEQQRRAMESAAARPSRPRKSPDQPDRLNTNLPRALTPLYGREREIEAVKDLVHASPLVTLTGTGGVGKTRLALEAAEQLLSEFENGVWFVDLAPISDPNLVPNAAAQIFGWSESADRPIVQRFVNALRNKDVLLLFDNCEHVVEGVAPFVQTLIQQCPKVRVLATSRQSLGVAGEQNFRVTSLDREAAVALFVCAGKRASEFFQPADSNRATIERIVQRLDGIALAIELAAARLKVLTPEQIEARLSERFRILTGGSQTQLRRHQTMRTTIDWSYDLLDVEERRLFRGLTVFAGSFSLEAAGIVCAGEGADEWNVIDVLASLVDKSLVVAEQSGTSQRYRLLESMRAYAREKVDGDTGYARITRRHAEYYTSLAQRAEADFRSVRSTAEWAASLEPELDNFRAALDWSFDGAGDALLGVRLLTYLQELWILHGASSEALGYARKALPKTDDLPQELEAALWLTIARMEHEYHMTPQDMFLAAERACELYEPLGESDGFGMALRERGIARMRLLHFGLAESDLQGALDIFKRVSDLRMVARTLGSIGYLRQIQGEYAEAHELMLQVQQLSAEIGDERTVSTIGMNVAETEFALGEVESAINRGRANLRDDLLRKSADLRSTQEANLSVYLLFAGRKEEAHSMALQALRDAECDYPIPLQHLASIFAPTEPRRAARLLGYVDKVLAGTSFSRELTEEYTHAILLHALRQKLSAEDIARLREQGASMSEGQALALARK